MAASKNRKHEDLDIEFLHFLLQNVKYQSCRTCRTGSATVPQSFTHSLQFFQESHSTGSVTSHPPETTRERRGDGGRRGWGGFKAEQNQLLEEMERVV